MKAGAHSRRFKSGHATDDPAIRPCQYDPHHAGAGHGSGLNPRPLPEPHHAKVGVLHRRGLGGPRPDYRDSLAALRAGSGVFRRRGCAQSVARVPRNQPVMQPGADLPRGGSDRSDSLVHALPRPQTEVADVALRVSHHAIDLNAGALHRSWLARPRQAAGPTRTRISASDLVRALFILRISQARLDPANRAVTDTRREAPRESRSLRWLRGRLASCNVSGANL